MSGSTEAFREMNEGGMAMLPMRVLVADDHRLFRQGLISLMKTRPDLVQVIGEAETGREAVTLASELRPDLVLMDIYMPHKDGLQAAQTILLEVPNVQIIMLTASELDEHFYEAAQMGVAGYLLKDLDAEELFALIEGVARGEAALTKAMAARLLKGVANRALDERKGEEALTDREIEVIKLLAHGATNPQIASELSITVNTVKSHISHILNKLQLENRTQAAAYAVQNRLVIPQ
jgi:two-component system nitrate/nitrite response regulator NarL